MAITRHVYVKCARVEPGGFPDEKYFKIDQSGERPFESAAPSHYFTSNDGVDYVAGRVLKAEGDKSWVSVPLYDVVVVPNSYLISRDTSEGAVH